MRNWKEEKGYTGVDIAISVVVLFLFVSIIAILSYNINSVSREIELKSEASAIAVEEIEGLKNEITFQEIAQRSIKNGNSEYLPTAEINKNGKQTGFYKTVLVEDYADHATVERVEGYVKKVIVKIQYQFKGKEQTVELSTIIAKEK